MIDATGTRRRLQALRWNGWTLPQLATLTGTTTTTLRRLSNGTTTTTREDLATTITNLYDQLWGRTPTPATPSDALGIAEARRHARHMQWAPALAWDNIDDPNEHPKGLDGNPAHADIGDALLLLRSGVSPEQAAARVGIKRASLARQLRRGGHHVWAARVERVQPC